jgi:tetratricopeptide (TPR) repeat protein
MQSSGFSFKALNFSKDNMTMIFDYYSSAIFFRTPIAANSNIYIVSLGILSILITAFFAFYKKTKKEIYKNIFYFLLPAILLIPNLAGERLWFQGNRMYLPLFTIITLFFSFLSPYIENKKTRKNSIVAISVLLLISAGITFNKSDNYKNGLIFWEAMIRQSNYINITAYKFHAQALMKNGKFTEAINEITFIAQRLNFSYGEINYMLGSAFMLNEDFTNAVRVFELMITNKQMPMQALANLILAYHYLGNKEKAEHYFNEFGKATQANPQELNDYINGFNAYLNKQRQTAKQRY